MSAKAKEQLLATLKPIIKQATLLDLTAASEPASAPSTRTCFGGRPYAEKGDSWPICRTCTKALTFICQLNMKDRKDADPSRRGLYTLFYCLNCFPGDSGPEGRGQLLVKYYPEPKKSAAVKLKDTSDPETRTKRCTVVCRPVDSLPDWDGLLARFPKVAETWNRTAPDPSTAYEEMCKELTKREDIDSQIGGFPAWIQSDDTPTCAKCNKLKSLLAQIDSEDAAGLMWGDAGSLYLFVCAEHPEDVDVIMQCY